MSEAATQTKNGAFALRVADFETKRAEARGSSISEAGGIEGYASLFDALDDGGDIVAAGAFRASLQRRPAAQLKMLWQHKADEPIGVWTNAVEDARGLRVRGRLDLGVARAREALSLLRCGALDGLSIGYRAKRFTKDRLTGVRRLIEVELLEISLVTFPMLAGARLATLQNLAAQNKHMRSALSPRSRADRFAARFEQGLQQLKS